jgi:hypothetical protein
VFGDPIFPKEKLLMASADRRIEKKVLEAVRGASSLPLQRVKDTVKGDKDTVSRAIRSLIDTGKLQLTLNWELRENAPNTGDSRRKDARKG